MAVTLFLPMMVDVLRFFPCPVTGATGVRTRQPGLLLLDVLEPQFHRGIPAEDLDEYRDLLLIDVDVLHHPLKSANGPEDTRIVSPISQAGRKRGGFFAASFFRPRNRSTSRLDKDVGLFPLPIPTNEVTPGVFRTACHESSSKYIRIRRYPGNIRFSTSTLRPPFISTTFSVGITTSKMRSCMCIDELRVARFALTFFSWPE